LWGGIGRGKSGFQVAWHAEICIFCFSFLVHFVVCKAYLCLGREHWARTIFHVVKVISIILLPLPPKTTSVFGSVVAVTFQIAFRVEIHANDVFSFFKNHFWHQHIKTIQKVQTALNFSNKKNFQNLMKRNYKRNAKRYSKAYKYMWLNR